jgi:2-polyprenyl-3-methyl-5-hydroxy-6-metoxy-1,4-benzoquinol methylase
MKLRSIVKENLPAPILHGLRKLLGRSSISSHMQHGQQNLDYYDNTFDRDPSWSMHYTHSPYYIIWTVIIDRLRRGNPKKILEIGCGSGQLASAIRDAGIAETYIGFDFSQKRLGQAKIACPQFSFEMADAFKTDLIEKADYDTVITTEFLEHVEDDLEIIRRIRPGTRVVATVPNFPYVSHVRHFQNLDDVVARYRRYFGELSVTTILADEKGKTFFLIDALR